MRYSSQRLHSRTALPVSALICIASVAAYAQQTAPAAPPAAAAAPAPAAAAPTSLSSSLGVIVFPAKDQSSGQQSTDEQACYGWAKSKTGIDPAHITAPQPADSQASSGGGERARGAARGAAGGALVGAVAGDAGTGAAVGATVGAISGGAAKRRAKKDAAAQQEQQAQAAIAQQKATYNKAFSACMEGKGYTVK